MLLATLCAAVCPAVLPVLAPNDVAADCDALLVRYARAGWSGSVLVVRGGKQVLAKGYGSADLAGARANDANTLFEIASLSKQFTAAAVLLLEQQGKLSLDDSIAKHLPGVPEHSRAITVHQLLAHTSGVPRENAGGRGEDLEAAVRAYLGDGPKGKPGTRFGYWNGGYALLAGIVERVSGASFTSFCETQLFAPAGLRDTGFTGDTDLPAERAAIGRSDRGAARSALEHPYGEFGYQYRGMGGVVTTVLDLAKWDRVLAGTTLLGDEAKKRLFAPVLEGYACGWSVGPGVASPLRVSHGGSVRGFLCEMRRFPAEKTCIVVLSNTDGMPVEPLADNLECLVFNAPLRQPVPDSAALSDKELAAFVGAYVNEAGRLVVRADAGALVAGIEGTALLKEFAPGAAATWNADVAELERAAVDILEHVAKGDGEPLRARLAKRIPATWPDQVCGKLYPDYAKDHGALKSVRSLGARVVEDRVEIVLALEHARTPGRVTIAFCADGLCWCEWRGPDFPATLRLVPRGGAKFSAPRGDGEARAFEFTRKGARVTALTSGASTWKRVD